MARIIRDRLRRKKKNRSADFTAHAGIPAYIDPNHAIAHNKAMVIDQTVVISGSFNFTNAAEQKNAENLLVIRSQDLAKVYTENCESYKEHTGR